MRGVLDYMRTMIAGPGHFRFLFQPVVALVFGILDGIRDQHHGRAPIGAEFKRLRGSERWRHLAVGLHRVILPMCIATLLSLVFQYWIRRSIHFVPALCFAIVFVALPYLLARGFSNRVGRRWHRSRPRRTSLAPGKQGPKPP
jgi:hypothetical protein